MTKPAASTTMTARMHNVMIMGVRFPLTGPMLGVSSRTSPSAPDIESAIGGVSPGTTPPPLSSPGVTAGSGPGLSLEVTLRR